MMKNIFVAIIGLTLMFMGTSCVKDRAFIEFDDLEKGAFPRALESPSGEFNYFDVANSSVSMLVEFYSEDQGQNVSSYDWTVGHVDNANSGGATIKTASLASFPSSQYSPAPSGLPSISITFTMQQVLDALGYTLADINGGDAFEFRSTLVLNDGREFTAENTSGQIIGQNVFNGLFIFRQNVICPSDLGGTYTVFTEYYQHDFIGAGFTENTLTGVDVRALGSGQYMVDDFSGGLYQADAPYGTAYGTSGLEVTFTDACGNISFSGEVDPWQNLLQDPARPSFVDPSTGVITICVLGDVYGENWCSVYTPE